jgi:hypothetical protein
MLGLPLRDWLKHPATALSEIAADPAEVWTTIRETYVADRERSRPRCRYMPVHRWDEWLHIALNEPWPCAANSELIDLWPRIMGELEAKGIRPGPMSFQGWNDGDAGLIRAIWCLTRHLRPRTVVETGVGHGVTSRFVLEALERNGGGHLWSIDLPPWDRDWRAQIGAAVGDLYAERWSYVKGSSRRRLPDLLARVGQIDLFIHDSLHSEHNVRFELDRVWVSLNPLGAIVVDDVDANWGFHSFTQAFSGHRAIVCEAEPIRPDPRRFNQKGLFGIILKQSY